jgi:hypothetical protein
MMIQVVECSYTDLTLDYGLYITGGGGVSMPHPQHAEIE